MCVTCSVMPPEMAFKNATHPVNIINALTSAITHCTICPLITTNDKLVIYVTFCGQKALPDCILILGQIKKKAPKLIYDVYCVGK